MHFFSLIKKFSLLLFAGFALMGIALGSVITYSMHQSLIHRANEMAADFLLHEIKNELDLATLAIPKTGSAYEELSRQIAGFNLGPDVLAIKIWNRDYTVVWATDENEVGEQSPGHHELEEAYEGERISEISSGDHLQEKYGHVGAVRQVMELYIPVRSGPQDDVSLVFEVYMSIDHLLADIGHHNRIIWGFIVIGTFLLYLLLFGLVRRASRQIDRQGTEISLSEERFRSLIRLARDGIITTDRSGKIFLINLAAEKIFGHTADEMQGMSFDQLFANADNDDFPQALKYFIDTGECSTSGESFELLGLHKNGQTISLEVSCSASGEEQNRVLTAMIRDISQRDKMLEQIALAKNEWEETFDTINDAITIHDQNFNILRANRAAEVMLGISMQSILAQKCFLSYHGTGCAPEKCPSCQTVQTGVASTTEIYEPHLDRYLEIKALPRFDDDKNLIGVIHVVRDITDRKKAEEEQEKLQVQLVQMQKMETVGRLAGGIAHDFNNILSVIIGYSELILHDMSADSQSYHDLVTIKKAGEKAAVLTGQLLAFSRKQVLKMQPVDLNKVINESMAKMLKRLIGEHIELDIHLTPGISNITADPGQLEQIMLNLAVNAGDAMLDGGHLIIETNEVQLEKDFIDQHLDAREGRYVLLAISDSGTGMTEEVRQQIFDPFFTTKERGKGTGLGLATVYGIVKQHESLIYVYSEPGKGTTFKIFFPASADAAVNVPDTIDTGLLAGEETILLAEDDQIIRTMIKNYLEPLGYNLLLAENGEEGVNVSRSYEGEIQLLLTDVIMPKMNGQQLADTIQKERPDIKVIFMSGYTDDAIAHHGVLAPGVNFIQKPITPSKLALMLHNVLNLS